MGSIFTVGRDKDEVIAELKSELERTKARLTEESRNRLEAEANVKRLQRNASKHRVIPSGDADEGYECPTMGCYVELKEDYHFCPGCGAEIDWHTSNYVDDSLYDRWRDYQYDKTLEKGYALCS